MCSGLCRAHGSIWHLSGSEIVVGSERFAAYCTLLDTRAKTSPMDIYRVAMPER